MSDGEENKKIKKPKKITPVRLKNIALYYLKRFDTTKYALRQVLLKRVKEYAFYNPDYDASSAYAWIDDILNDFERYGYVDDARFVENKCRDYLAQGKSQKYILMKLRQKGVSEEVIKRCLNEQEYSPFEAALLLARKKKIACFRKDETQRKEMRQKDMGTLVRAGFDYDTVVRVLDYEPEEE